MTRTLDADAVIADLRVTANAFWEDALAYARLGRAEDARIARAKSAVVQQIARTLNDHVMYESRSPDDDGQQLGGSALVVGAEERPMEKRTGRGVSAISSTAAGPSSSIDGLEPSDSLSLQIARTLDDQAGYGLRLVKPA